MKTIKEKIKNTALLGDEDKIAILAAMDGYSQSDVQELERIVDEFDQAYSRSVAQYKKVVYGVLDDIASHAKPDDAARMHAATAQVKEGVDTLLSS